MGKNVAAKYKYNFTDPYVGKFFIYNLVDIYIFFLNFDVQPTAVWHIKQQSEVKCHSSGHK